MLECFESPKKKKNYFLAEHLYKSEILRFVRNSTKKNTIYFQIDKTTT